MFFTTAALSLGCLAVASARPMPRASAPTDADILNFALTLEHLENTFYSEALAKYSSQDFINAGLPVWAYGRFKEISEHEAAHVQFLSTALGAQATQPCTYSFPYTDPLSFVSLSRALEGVGTSAYIGASTFIQNKDYLLAAATVLSTEARHSTWADSAVRHSAGWSGPYDTPLDLNQVYTIASAFITSCPESNPKLPVSAFPALSFSANPTPGQTADLTYTPPDGVDASVPLFVAFLSGQSAVFVALTDSKKVAIPSDLRGTVYALISTDGSAVNDNTTIAGPAVLDFSYNSNGDVIQLPF
ncbi:ferritin-like domain-containing protein [Amylostereum chailletii]|nr:ferritin-like domain-containing protein [Amylostereum chailletii]